MFIAGYGRGEFVDPRQIGRLAERSANFGFLKDHPLLVFYGAGAEALVYVDAQAAMFKTRSFGEVLAQDLVRRTNARPVSEKFVHQVRALNADGTLVPHIYAAFERLRSVGNQAVHDHLDELRTALELLRTCFELGLWFHRALTGDRSPIGFVPPTPPPEQVSATVVEGLQAEITRYKRQLADTKLLLEGKPSLAQARDEAALAAERTILAADARRGEAATLVVALTPAAQAAQQEFESAKAPKVSAAKREDFIARARRASREPLNEVQTRVEIDRQLTAAGWLIQDESQINLYAGTGVAVREVTLATGRADYLLYVEQRLVGVIEAKREGTAPRGVEAQLDRYLTGLTAEQKLAAWRRDAPLPFGYVATGTETAFVNRLDPFPRTREIFAFHRPETLARWMREADDDPAAPTLRHRLRRMPALDRLGLRPAQIDAIEGLERSLAEDRPRSLIQMATGAGKTYTAVTASYRQLKHARARRILFLVDRNNLGKQTLREYAAYQTPDDGRKFTELYPVDRLSGARMLNSSVVVISTIQRLYAALRGADLPDVDLDDRAYDSYELDAPAEVSYNPHIPPETFDLIVVDECHRSIYGKWRAVIEYFDAFVVGLTATPVKQTMGFFQQNLVSEYTYEQAVADGVNVGFDVYRIKTQITEAGEKIEAGTVVPLRDRRTRAERYQELEDDFTYAGSQVGRSVISKGQLKLVLKTFRDRLFSEIFPGRSTVPKTLIFACDDNHAEEILTMVRLVFGRGNEFAAKITYASRRDGDNPDTLLQAFRNSPELRIAVTVDMIATGTDVRPLECVFFLRPVRSATYFEQMKGRGARTIDIAEFQAVTPDAEVKDRFVIVDAVGVTEADLDEAVPLQRHTERQISLRDLLRKAGTLTASADEVATLASRLSRLNQQLTDAERQELADLAEQPLTGIVRGMVEAVAPEQLSPAKEAGTEAVRDLLAGALRPLAANPALRERILEIRRAHDITIDEVNADTLLSAAGVPAEERAQVIVKSWHDYLEQHRDEITALQVFYEGRGRIGYEQLKELAARIARPPQAWTPESLWKAYVLLGRTAEEPGSRGVTDLVSLVRYELGLDQELRPYRSLVEERFRGWLLRQEQAGATFTADQVWWLERIKDVIAVSVEVTPDDLDGAPFTERGGIDGYAGTFGDRAAPLLEELNQELSA
ncbi:type I restriction-modification enzyme R subunit C-terminal domain-containing protein [Micromonospora sp. C28SCA-DRY-2]|uniref:type I restriction endonuclease subunit R n=1 Tax=Micromonospora sp. C28SCA-DRY-2 TaxID=3059522 RepID=UPI002676CC27|nr:type I restriction-modification enzyme R subunit C-terminal domain-containing protein [Micromonospora sp. C28SCA-DRY-2]MDO3704712.1 type I restriction-modification enzyme R subunit C-terminal domain-containing protein [Micromonospora sp. C28SCA-DRY-2]